MKKILSICTVFALLLFACGSAIACECPKDANNITEAIEALTNNDDCKCEKTCDKSECGKQTAKQCCKNQEKCCNNVGINQDIKCASKKSCANKKSKKCCKRKYKDSDGTNCTKGCPLENILYSIEE